MSESADLRTGRTAGNAIASEFCHDFLDAIASVIASRGWEALIPVRGKDGSCSYLAHPVIGWALTISGRLRVLTAAEPHGIVGDYGLRAVGSSQVYGRWSAEPWLNADHWLATYECEAGGWKH